MSEETAFQVKVALIDEYNGLTNIQSGHDSNDFGTMNVNQIEKIYALEKLKVNDFDPNDKLLIIKIKEEHVIRNENDIYATVKYAWVLSKKRVKDIKKVAAVINGVIVKVYNVDE